MRPRYFRIVSILLIGISILFIACSDNSTDTSRRTTDRLFYISSRFSEQIACFNADREKFESYIVPDTFGYVYDAIGNNESLVIRALNYDCLILDLDSNKYVHNLGPAASVDVSPNSHYVSLLKYIDGPTGGYDPYISPESRFTLEVRGVPDYGLVHLDTDVANCCFGPESRYLAYTHTVQFGHNGNVLVVYDLITETTLEEGYKRFPFEIKIEKAIPIESKNKVVFHGTGDGDHLVCISDIGSPTMKILKQIPDLYFDPYSADIAVSPDGERMYIVIIPASGYAPQEQIIYVYNTETELPAQNIDLESKGFQPHKMIITPDGKYMMAVAVDYAPDEIILIDLESGDVVFEYPQQGHQGFIAATLRDKN